MRNELRAAWRSQAGYTLLEMVVMFSIIFVLTGMTVANTQFGDKRQVLRDQAAELVTWAKQAATNASSSTPVAVNGDENDKQPRKAYGLCLTTESGGSTPKCTVSGGLANAYQLYARPVGATDIATAPTGGNIDVISTKHLPAKYVVIANPVDATWLDFKPPGPSASLKGGTTDGSLTVKFASGDSYTKRVDIKPTAGAVYVGD